VHDKEAAFERLFCLRTQEKKRWLRRLDCIDSEEMFQAFFGALLMQKVTP